MEADKSEKTPTPVKLSKGQRRVIQEKAIVWARIFGFNETRNMSSFIRWAALNIDVHSMQPVTQPSKMEAV